MGLRNNNNLALRSFAQLRVPRYKYAQRSWLSNSNSNIACATISLTFTIILNISPHWLNEIYLKILTIVLILYRLGIGLRTLNILSQATGYLDYRVSIYISFMNMCLKTYFAQRVPIWKVPLAQPGVPAKKKRAV